MFIPASRRRETIATTYSGVFVISIDLVRCGRFHAAGLAEYGTSYCAQERLLVTPPTQAIFGTGACENCLCSSSGPTRRSAYSLGGRRLANQKRIIATIATTRQAGRNKCMKRISCGIFVPQLCFLVSYRVLRIDCVRARNVIHHSEWEFYLLRVYLRPFTDDRGRRHRDCIRPTTRLAPRTSFLVLSRARGNVRYFNRGRRVHIRLWQGLELLEQ